MKQNALHPLVMILAVLALMLSGCVSRVQVAQEAQPPGPTPTPVLMSPPSQEGGDLSPTPTPVPDLPASTPVPDPGPGPTPVEPALAMTMPPPLVRDFPGLRLLEFPLQPDGPEMQDCSTRPSLTNHVFDYLWQTRSPSNLSASPTITDVNQVIQPFGLHLEQDEAYQLYKDGQWLRSLYSLPGASTFQVSPGGSYVWRIHDTVVEGWMLHNDQVFENVNFQDQAMLMPRLLGEDLLEVKMDYSGDDTSAYVVLINGQEVYSITNTSPSFFITDCPAQCLQVWDGHWILDMEDVVVMDGQLLSEQLGYEQVFEWLLFGGKPLLFYKDSAGYGLSYDGAQVPLPYDLVYHQCFSVTDALGCAVGIRQTEETVYFFAVRDSIWYFVEIEQQ